jgi:hypothetical protein
MRAALAIAALVLALPGGAHWRLRFDVSPRGRVAQIASGDETLFYVEGCA